jgi:hypothetical protein
MADKEPAPGTQEEFPDYYTRLDKSKAEAGTYWASRR